MTRWASREEHWAQRFSEQREPWNRPHQLMVKDASFILLKADSVGVDYSVMAPIRG